MEGQTKQVLDNMGAILKAAGVDYKDVVKTTILLVRRRRGAHAGIWLVPGKEWARAGSVEGG